MTEPSKHTHPGDGTVPGLHGEPILTPVLGCPACVTVRSIGSGLGAAPGGSAPSLTELALAQKVHTERRERYLRVADDLIQRGIDAESAEAACAYHYAAHQIIDVCREVRLALTSPAPTGHEPRTDAAVGR